MKLLVILRARIGPRSLVCACLLCLLSIGASAASMSTQNAEEAARLRASVLALAGEPVPYVSYFRVHYWISLDEYTLVMWLGREEPYLVTLRDRCVGISRDNVLRVTDYKRPGRNRLRSRWSMVFTREGHTCRLDTIQPLNLEGMRKLDTPKILPGEDHAPATG